MSNHVLVSNSTEYHPTGKYNKSTASINLLVTCLNKHIAFFKIVFGCIIAIISFLKNENLQKKQHFL